MYIVLKYLSIFVIFFSYCEGEDVSVGPGPIDLGPSTSRGSAGNLKNLKNGKNLRDASTSAHLKPCGELTCGGGERYEYCSPIEHSCKDCAEVCDSTLRHKFDLERCQSDCQDYLHDSRYASKTEFLVEMDRLTRELKSIKILVSVCLGMLAAIIVGTIGTLSLYYFMRRRRNQKNCRNSTKNDPEKPPISNPQENQLNSQLSTPEKEKYLQEEIRMNIMNNLYSGNGSANDSNSDNSTPTISNNPRGKPARFQKRSERKLGSREPSESTLPPSEYFYQCYDNPALSHQNSGELDVSDGNGNSAHTTMTGLTASTPLSARELLASIPPGARVHGGGGGNGQFSLTGSVSPPLHV